eukprot:Skav202714  [mRNA]  locus=scaffold654:679398:686215:+ [translate_table: standard]
MGRFDTLKFLDSVLSSTGWETASSRPWHISAAAMLFWLLVCGWLLFLFLTLQRCAAPPASCVSWKDENFVLKVPEIHQPRTCWQSCQALWRGLRDISPLRSLRFVASSARTTDWEEALALYVGLLGVHCVLASRSGVSVTMLRRHLINKDGWKLGSFHVDIEAMIDC